MRYVDLEQPEAVRDICVAWLEQTGNSTVGNKHAKEQPLEVPHIRAVAKNATIFNEEVGPSIFLYLRIFQRYISAVSSGYCSHHGMLYLQGSSAESPPNPRILLE